MRRGRDVLTITVRLDQRHREILSYFINKYAGCSGTFADRFRKMLEGIDDRALEHTYDPDLPEGQDQPMDPEVADCWQDVVET